MKNLYSVLERNTMNEQPKSMYFIYIDESYDEVHYCYSAFLFLFLNGNDIFEEVFQWRKN